MTGSISSSHLGGNTLFITKNIDWEIKLTFSVTFTENNQNITAKKFIDQGFCEIFWSGSKKENQMVIECETGELLERTCQCKPLVNYPTIFTALGNTETRCMFPCDLFLRHWILHAKANVIMQNGALTTCATDF